VSRGLASPFVTALQAGHVQAFPLIEVGFDSGTLYLCGLDHDVTWSGNTYTGALSILQIDPVRETADSYQGLRITLGGVTSTVLSLALQEPMQGRPITVRLAALDASGAMQVDANVWSGLLDVPEIEDGESPTVVLVAEHIMATWDRPRVRRYTDAQLQADYPGDLGLQYISAMEQARLAWPSAEFYKQ